MDNCALKARHIPSVAVLDGEVRPSQEKYTSYSGNVIYLSTFSKILAPGLRLGWIIAPPEVIRKLVQAKQGADLHTATFNQVVAHEVGKGGFLDQHVKLIRKVYRERRDVMLDALEEFMPEGVKWTHPEGGLFLWATLPEYMDATADPQTGYCRKSGLCPWRILPSEWGRKKHDAFEFLHANAGKNHGRNGAPR